MPDTAILITAGHLGDIHGKSAHGLIRGPSRWEILGVIDPAFAGRDAGEVVDGRARGIPVFDSLDGAVAALGRAPDWLVVGVTAQGGRMPAEARELAIAALRRGIGVVNGLHQLLDDDPVAAAAAVDGEATIVDVRRPKRFEELRFWTGEVLGLAVARVAVLGTDCALGKRTTATFLAGALRRQGVRTELVTTGQTGWLQGYRYGFVLDATPNDFVAGELERAVLACAREASPDLILVEGQSALRNPSGPCGAELILSSGARGVVLVHAPGRELFEGLEPTGARIPTLASEVALIAQYGASVLGIALNGEGLDDAALARHAEKIEAELALPVSRPLVDGGEPLVPALSRFARAALAGRDDRTVG